MALYRPLVYVVNGPGLSDLFRRGHISHVKQFRNIQLTHVRKSRWSNRRETEVSRPKFAETPFKGLQIENNPLTFSSLWKPFCFTIAFSSGSLAGCAIWQYENMRAKAMSVLQRPVDWAQEKLFRHTKKRAEWRQQVHNFWNSLTEGQKLFAPILFANIVVFLAWRIPRFQPAMIKYFCSNPASRVVCWPMVLSTFSHYSLFHICANMYVLHSFCSGAVAALGKEQFLGLYLSAGVISSFSSFFYKVVTNQPGLSIGASGAIMAILGYVCTQYPDTKLSIILLPMYTFTAGTAIKFIMGLDLAGVLLGWKFFDHAAHLGGALCGIGWCYWGNAYIWQKREPLLHWWHELRTTDK